MKKTISLLIISLLTGCYGVASLETCTAKHITDGKGGPGSFERCMETAQREKGVRDWYATPEGMMYRDARRAAMWNGLAAAARANAERQRPRRVQRDCYDVTHRGETYRVCEH